MESQCTICIFFFVELNTVMILHISLTLSTIKLCYLVSNFYDGGTLSLHLFTNISLDPTPDLVHRATVNISGGMKHHFQCGLG